MKLKGILTGLIFLIISIIFWGAITLSNEYTTDILVPVQIINNSKDFAIDEEIPTFLKLKIKSTGWNIIRTKFNNEKGLFLKLEDYPNNTVLQLKDFLANDYKLIPNIQILDVYPSTIKLPRRKAVEKYLKIIPKLNLTFKEGYDIVSSPVVSPDMILARGTSGVLAKIDSIYTKEIKLDKLFEDVKVSVPVEDTLINSISFDKKNVEVSFKVEQIADKVLSEIPVLVKNAPMNSKVETEPKKISLLLRGGIITLSNMDINSIRVEVDMMKVNPDSLQFVKPEIFVPNGIRLLNAEPEYIKIKLN